MQEPPHEPDGPLPSRPPLHVLYIASNFPPETAGAASRTFGFAKYLDRRDDLRLDVFCPHPTYPFGFFPRCWKPWQRRTVDQARVLSFWTWQPRTENPGIAARAAYYLCFPAMICLHALLHARRYDAIVSSLPPLYVAVLPWFQKAVLRSTWIIDLADLWIDVGIELGFIRAGSLSERLHRAFEHRAYRRADLIRVTSRHCAAEILRRYPDIPEEKVLVLYNGADLETFHPRDVPQQPRILYAGRLGYAQPLENFLRAMPAIRQSHNVEFLIMGHGERKADLIALARSLHLDDCVRFQDPVPHTELPVELSRARIGIVPLGSLPSLHYAVPTKLYEYAACGLPFVCAGHGEIEAITKASGAGVHAEDNPDAIAAAVRSLLDDEAKRRTMRQNALAFAQEYSRESIAQTMADALQRLHATHP